MSEVKIDRNTDFAWFLTSRLAALALVTGLVLVWLSDSRHQEVSQAQAVAVHRADMEAHMRKPERGAPGVRPVMTSER